MTTPDSNMPISRQLRYERECRDKWKDNALKKQAKIREQVQAIRALKKSRDSWKAKAQLLKQRVLDLENQLQQQSDSSNSNSSDSPDSSPTDSEEYSDSQTTDFSTSSDSSGVDSYYPSFDPGIFDHQYSLSTMFVAVQNVISAGLSYRSIARSLQFVSPFSTLGSPHFTTIKSWVERLGLYELQRPKPYRHDWIFLVDFVLELGQEYALVIYGISHRYWSQHILPEGRSLRYTDGEILALEITTCPTGEWVHSVLQSLSSKVGVPFQVISDHGSNLKKGIELFHSSHPHFHYIYDVTHAMAKLLEKQLFKDDIFPQFLHACHHCRLSVQRTEFAFASPPPQRSRCRFFNLDPLLRWATTLLSNPLSLFFKLLPNYTPQRISHRFFHKFSWLFPYYKHIQHWSLLLQMTRSLETIVKSHGLNPSSISLLQKALSSLSIPSSLLPFKSKLFDYLSTQLSSNPPFSLLATSDILESLFGRYKHFSRRSPLKELRSLLLTIPLSTVKITRPFLRDGLTTVTNSDLSQWVNNTFGQSMLSKRKHLFSF